MASAFPAALDTFNTDFVDATLQQVVHPAAHNDERDAIKKIETKLGTGASTPAAGMVLGSTGSGVSAWSASPSVTSLAASASLAAGSNPAQSGNLRMSNAGWLAARNAANNGDVNVIRVNASNQIELGTALASLSVLGALAIGSGVPAQSGDLRLQNTSWIVYRNAANNGDIGVIRLNASDLVELGTLATHTIADGQNIVLGTGTGTKIGTATGQKVGFFNASPVAQPGNITLTNYSSGARSFNRSAYTMDQLADFVCQLYFNIKSLGLNA